MADLHFPDTYFLLNIQDSGDLVDRTGNYDVTVNGSPSVPDGMDFDGTNDWLEVVGGVAQDFGNAFTKEFVFRFNSLTGTQVVWTNDGTGTDLQRLYLTGGSLKMEVGGVVKASFTPSNLTFYQVAFERESSGTSRLYIDGVPQGSTWDDDHSYLDVDGMRIGADFAGANRLSGRLSSVRFTAVARYAADYSASLPDLPFPEFYSTIMGHVYGPDGLPASYRVELMDAQLTPISSVFSNVGTGLYAFDVLTNEEHVLSCRSPSSDDDPPVYNHRFIRVIPPVPT